MKIYEIIIKPKSSFTTLLKGDTIFGNLCWHINYNNNSLQTLLQCYDTNPFMVVSSAVILLKDNNTKKYIFKKPNAPEEILFTKNEQWVKDRKERQKKQYFILQDNSCFIENIKDIYLAQEEIIKFFYTKKTLQHNTINRETCTTGTNQFAPWTISTNFYNEKLNLVFFVAIDEAKFTIEDLKKSFCSLGVAGFGKKSSIGYGIFDVISCEESNLFKNLNKNTNYVYTIAPCVPKKDEICEEKSYFQPFTRFGKHGDILAKSDNPFKKPIIMMDEYSLIKLNKTIDYNYPIIGSAITNVSNVDVNTVAQGYTLCLPVNLED